MTKKHKYMLSGGLCLILGLFAAKLGLLYNSREVTLVDFLVASVLALTFLVINLRSRDWLVAGLSLLGLAVSSGVLAGPFAHLVAGLSLINVLSFVLYWLLFILVFGVLAHSFMDSRVVYIFVPFVLFLTAFYCFLPVKDNGGNPIITGVSFLDFVAGTMLWVYLIHTWMQGMKLKICRYNVVHIARMVYLQPVSFFTGWDHTKLAEH